MITAHLLSIDKLHPYAGTDRGSAISGQSLSLASQSFWLVRTTLTLLQPFARHLVGKMDILAAHLLITISFKHFETNKSPLKIGLLSPKGKYSSLPTTNFQGRFRGTISDYDSFPCWNPLLGDGMGPADGPEIPRVFGGPLEKSLTKPIARLLKTNLATSGT